MRDPSTATSALVDTPCQPPGWKWDPETGLSCLSQDPPPLVEGDPSAAYTPIPAVTWSDTTLTDAGPPAAGHPHVSDATMLQNCHRTLRMVSARFAHIIAETLDGQRRLSQVETWFDPSCVKVLSGRLPQLQGTRVRLASVRVQPMSETCAEVTIRLSTDHLDYAAALRVTQRDNQWACTDLVMG